MLKYILVLTDTINIFIQTYLHDRAPSRSANLLVIVIVKLMNNLGHAHKIIYSILFQDSDPVCGR